MNQDLFYQPFDELLYYGFYSLNMDILNNENYSESLTPDSITVDIPDKTDIINNQYNTNMWTTDNPSYESNMLTSTCTIINSDDNLLSSSNTDIENNNFEDKYFKVLSATSRGTVIIFTLDQGHLTSNIWYQ